MLWNINADSEEKIGIFEDRSRSVETCVGAVVGSPTVPVCYDRSFLFLLTHQTTRDHVQILPDSFV